MNRYSEFGNDAPAHFLVFYLISEILLSKDKQSNKYIRGVACPKCYNKKTQKQKSRYISRQKQINLAKKNNLKHIGPKEA